ncbi:unnamed protein product [Urochloa humidicola]
MASSSSGDGPSTSGDRRSEQEPAFYFVGFNARASTMVLQDLNEAVLFQNITKARDAANKLKAMGMSPDEAVEAEARDYPESKRQGPLHVAAKNRHTDMCKMLIEGYGCDPNATNAAGILYFPPLFLCCAAIFSLRFSGCFCLIAHFCEVFGSCGMGIDGGFLCPEG